MANRDDILALVKSMIDVHVKKNPDAFGPKSKITVTEDQKLRIEGEGGEVFYVYVTSTGG